MGFGKSKLVEKEVEKETEEKEIGEVIEEPQELDGESSEEPEEEYLVVKELPVQPIKSYKDPETGKVTNLSTMEESLTNIENHLRKITGGL